MVKTVHFQSRRHGQGTKISHAGWSGQQKEKKKKGLFPVSVFPGKKPASRKAVKNILIVNGSELDTTEMT